MAVLALVIVLSLLAGFCTRTWLWAPFCFLVLFLSLESFYFPTRYILGDERLVVVKRFSRSEREWGIFRRCYLDPEGLTLSPYRKSSWLEAYRAIRLRFCPENREAVIGFVRHHLGSDVEWIRDRRWKQNATAQ